MAGPSARAPALQALDGLVAGIEPEVRALFAEDLETDYVLLRPDGVVRLDRVVFALPELETWPAVRRKLAAMVLHQWICAEHPSSNSKIAKALATLARQRLGWTTEEVGWLLDAVPERPLYGAYRLAIEARLPLAAAAQLGVDDLRDVSKDVERVAAIIERTETLGAADRRRMGKQLAALREKLGVAPSPIPPTLLHDGDHFGPEARSSMAEALASPGVVDLLLHGSAQERVEPTKKWRARAAELLAAAPQGRDVVHALLDLFCRQPDGEISSRSGSWHDWAVVHDDSETLLRGLVWLLADADEAWVTPLLAAVTTHAATAFRDAPGFPHCPRLANSAVLVLSRRPGELPITTLCRLSLTVKNNALKTRLSNALLELGSLRGWSPGEVAELAVDGHGLDGDGRHVESLDGYEAIVAIDADTAKVSLTFQRAGKALKSVPAAVKDGHSERLGAVRALAKGVTATLAVERLRLDQLMSYPGSWPWSDWAQRYLDHPVTSVFARRLLWEAGDDGEAWRSGVPRRDGDGWVLVDRDGAAITGERVRLWHPIRASVEEISGWRDQIHARGLRQPFKQAFREIYLLTPAEEETRHYSNRFAGHILRYRQANALMRTRGWKSNYLGYFSEGYNGEAVKDFGDGEWRAQFYHDLVENAEPGDIDARYCSTDQVRFARRDGAVWDPASVIDVPAAVFSEAMRDVDLFVGVTSIAADPAWLDRGEDRFNAYWQRTVFGELTATAEIRREALARLLPRTKIAARVELADRFLRVVGIHRSYKIHLGSGNILMEPDDSYLCIVPGRERASTLRLPFEEDPMLSVILSKAFLLAADDKITDETILRQIGR